MGDRPPRSAATRALAGTALAGVSVIAAVASYSHALAVVQAAGATRPVAWLVPALADLVILGASADLLDAARTGSARPPLAVVSLAVGIGVTLSMNVAAGWHHGVGGRLVAGWPALAFVLSLESLAGLVRRGRGAFPGAPPDTADRCPHGVPNGVGEAVRAAWAHQRDCLGARPTYTALGEAFGVDRRKVAEIVAAAEERGRGGGVPSGGASAAPAAQAALNGDGAHG